MRDPGNPRSAVEKQDARPPVSTTTDDWVRPLSAGLRGLCLVAAFIVMAISIYYAIHVFGRVGQLVLEPEVAEQSVASLAKMIDAEKLAVAVPGGEPVAPGNLIAFLLLLFCYLLWFWIPMTMFGASARIILRSMPGRDRDKTVN